jgi:transcriptional regulator with XRE-family HTH domain
MQKTLHTRQYALLLDGLRSIRRNAGLTQHELGDRLDMTQSEVSKCERGIRRLDAIELRLWLAALSVDVVDFFREFERRIDTDALASKRIG